MFPFAPALRLLLYVATPPAFVALAAPKHPCATCEPEHTSWSSALLPSLSHTHACACRAALPLLQGVLADVQLLQEITEACRNCVREFVKERTGS